MPARRNAAATTGTNSAASVRHEAQTPCPTCHKRGRYPRNWHDRRTVAHWSATVGKNRSAATAIKLTADGTRSQASAANNRSGLVDKQTVMPASVMATIRDDCSNPYAAPSR